MTRRRALMAQKIEDEELYPVGTDLVAMYIGRDVNGLGLFNHEHTISNVSNTIGEYVEGPYNAASPIYLPIDPKYRYQKNKGYNSYQGGRMYYFTWYDANHNFISQFSENNFDNVDLPAPPSNARYARFATHDNDNNWGIAIIRIS